MKIVVTGASGQLGRALVHRLGARGHDVIAVSRDGAVPEPPFESPAGNASVRGLAVDLASDDSIARLSVELGAAAALVHLAAWRPLVAAPSTVSRQRLVEVNVLGTLRVLDAVRCARDKPGVVVCASCAEVYGAAAGDQPLTELSPLKPITDYAATKLAAEDHLRAFAIEEQIRVVALRMARLYGPDGRQPSAFDAWLCSAARGDRPKLRSSPSAASEQLQVRDAALAVERALTSEASGTFNISDGTSRSTLELARLAMQAAGLRGEPELEPRFEDEAVQPRLSIERARRELQFEPEVSLLDGLSQQLRWLRAAGEAAS